MNWHLNHMQHATWIHSKSACKLYVHSIEMYSKHYCRSAYKWAHLEFFFTAPTAAIQIPIYPHSHIGKQSDKVTAKTQHWQFPILIDKFARIQLPVTVTDSDFDSNSHSDLWSYKTVICSNSDCSWQLFCLSNNCNVIL